MRRAAVLRTLAALCLCSRCLAQSPPAPPAPPASTGDPHGTVILQRGAQTATPDTATPDASAPGTLKQTTPESQIEALKIEVTDAERRALTFTAYSLDIRLTPRDGSIAVRAKLTVRNDSDHSLTRLPLQLSSTLDWSSIRIHDRSATFAHHLIDSDADHTGELNEALVTLGTPLAPQAELTLDVVYSGQIAPNAKRLVKIGTPPDLAARSDWDGISAEFTGLRGFGNVVWYPVSSVPVALGDGDKLFAEIGALKLRQSSANVFMSVTEESYGVAPTITVANGVVVPVRTVVASTEADLPTIVACNLPQTALGFGTPSLFIATRTERSGNYLNIFAREPNLDVVSAYMTASSTVTPQMREWLGARPKADLTVLDLPNPEDAPAEERQLLLTGLQSVEPRRLADAMSHALTHAFFVSPRPWLDQGVAEFMASLWTEATQGRDAAIAQLDNRRSALALAEPASPDADPGQSLLAAHDAIFYGTKATYVLWMLREIVGKPALSAALRAYDPHKDTNNNYFQGLVEGASNKKLDWFFNDWVYRDRGLPDLSIEGVYPSQGSGTDNYIVAVTVSNEGYASAEVPVTVTSAITTETERLLIPARGKVTHRVLIQGHPTEVQVNDGSVPEVEASVHRKTLDYTKQ